MIIDKEGNAIAPLMIGEVVSNDDETDRWRMLLQAIALLRCGLELIPNGPFFVVAIYITKKYMAIRYVVYKLGSSDTVRSFYYVSW